MENKTVLREEIIKIYQRRFATKSFDKNRKISEADWETIIETGRLSPSSFGYEPWKFILIENQAVREGLQDVAWGARNSLAGASHFLMVLVRKNLTGTHPHIKHMVEDVFGSEYSATSPQTTFFNQFQQEDFQLTSQRALFDWTSKQSYIALGNMLTTAAWLGIDSCPIEGFNREKVEKYLESTISLDLKEFGVSYMAGFGYRDQAIPLKKRQPLADVYEVI